MYKRKDWVFTHNPDGPASDGDSDSDDSESESDHEQPDVSGSESSDEGGDDGSGDVEAAKGGRSIAAKPAEGKLSAAAGSHSSSDEEEEEEGGADGSSEEASEGGSDRGGGAEAGMDMEALQEMMDREDEEENSGRKKRRRAYSDADDLEDVRASWLVGDKGDRVKAALRCLLCPGSLLLNAESFKAHLTSRKHLRAAAAASLDETAQLESIVWAEAISADDYGAETHAERLTRLEQKSGKSGAGLLSGGEAADAPHNKAARKRGGKQWKEKQAKQGDKPKGKGKPGRRQRLALKEGLKKKAAQKKEKLSKRKESRQGRAKGAQSGVAAQPVAAST